LLALNFTATGAPLAATHTKFADESICLLADNIWNEVVTIHRPQMVLKMLSLYKWTFLAPVEMVLIYPLMLLCRNICHFPKKMLFNVFSVRGLLL
jgi:hypothetical protein